MAYTGIEAGRVIMEQEKHMAPFVAKMYEMVSNPSTDYLIRWGREDNTFLILDPSQFSQRLLPFYFKHCNLSSFIRQLNIYGFRKVDPDRWEFAHESFLKGQIHLLPLIVRQRKRAESDKIGRKLNEEEEEESLMVELGRLKEEQRALEEEIEGVNRRLQDTEQRPKQIMSFLVKLAEDSVVGSGEEQEEQEGRRDCLVGEKRRRVGGDCDGGGERQVDFECQNLFVPETSSPEFAPPRNVAFPFCLLGEGFFY